MRRIKLLNVSDHSQADMIRVSREIFGRAGIDATHLIEFKATVIEDVLYVHVGSITLSLPRGEFPEVAAIDLETVATTTKEG